MVSDSESSGVKAASSEGQLTRSLLADLVPGAVVDGKYRVDRAVGRGAMGIVVAATHLQLGEQVALKFLLPRFADDEQHDRMAVRFKREARVTAKLRSEHIARVLDVGTWRHGTLYMVLELLEGADLGALQKEHGAFPIDVAVDYVVQVCDGLAEAHARGIVHRDLKPSNLFIARRLDGSPLVKILDFGVSKWGGEVGLDEGLTETGVVLGTPRFMAPEQLFAAGNVDARADVWSVGAILFMMLTGRAPYVSTNFAQLCADIGSGLEPTRLRDLMPKVPPALDEAVASMLAIDRDRRAQNVSVAAHALLRAIGAPNAESVRVQLEAMLGNAQLTMTTGEMHSATRATGQPASSSATGSSSALRVSRTQPATVTTVEAPTIDPALARSRRGLIAALVALSIAAIAISALGVRAHRSPAAAAVAPTPIARPAPPIAAPSSISSPAAVTPPTLKEDAPRALVASSAPSSPSVLPPVAPAVVVHKSPPRVDARAPSTSAPEVAASVPAPVVVAPAPTASASGSSRKKALEDRQ